MSPLPAEAQLVVLDGMVEDFDNDGNLDDDRMIWN